MCSTRQLHVEQRRLSCQRELHVHCIRYEQLHVRVGVCGRRLHVPRDAQHHFDYGRAFAAGGRPAVQPHGAAVSGSARVWRRRHAGGVQRQRVRHGVGCRRCAGHGAEREHEYLVAGGSRRPDQRPRRSDGGAGVRCARAAADTGDGVCERPQLIGAGVVLGHVCAAGESDAFGCRARQVSLALFVDSAVSDVACVCVRVLW